MDAARLQVDGNPVWFPSRTQAGPGPGPASESEPVGLQLVSGPSARKGAPSRKIRRLMTRDTEVAELGGDSLPTCKRAVRTRGSRVQTPVASRGSQESPQVPSAEVRAVKTSAEAR